MIMDGSEAAVVEGKREKKHLGLSFCRRATRDPMAVWEGASSGNYLEFYLERANSLIV